jgi:hypothetical protein
MPIALNPLYFPNPAAGILYISFMVTFLWKHKIFTLLLIAAAAYFFVNPAGRFGYCRKNLVVFNRLPVSFFDLTISPDGKAQPLENISGKDALSDFFLGFMHKSDDENVLLIVGTGFDAPSFQLSDDKAVSLESRNINVKQLPSREAVSLYNTSVDQGRKVALLLCIKH